MVGIAGIAGEEAMLRSLAGGDGGQVSRRWVVRTSGVVGNEAVGWGLGGRREVVGGRGRGIGGIGSWGLLISPLRRFEI